MALKTIFASVLLLLAFVSPAMAIPATDAEKKAFLEGLARPLPQDLKFYRWQSKTSGENLLNEGVFSDKLHNYFMNMEVDWTYLHAGRGIYAGEEPFSASRFVRGGADGTLIHVEVAKGTPYLDMTDPSTIKTLADNGISPKEAFTLDPQIAMKYEGEHSWWVLKGKQGVKFSPFNGSTMPIEELISGYPKLAHRRARQIYSNMVRPYLAEQAVANPALLARKEVQDMLGKYAASEVIQKIMAGPEEKWAPLMMAVKDSPFLRGVRDSDEAVRRALEMGEAKLMSVKDVIATLSAGDGEKGTRLLEHKLRQSATEAEYMELLDTLGKEAGKDVKVRLQIDPKALEAIQPKATISPAGKARVTELVGKLHTGDADFTLALSELGKRPFADRVTRVRTLDQIAARPESTGAMRSKLKVIKEGLFSPSNLARELPKLTPTQRAMVLDHALPNLNGADDLISVLKAGWGAEIYDPSLADVLVNHGERFRQWSMDPGQARAIANFASADPTQKVSLLKIGMEKAATGDQVVSLLKPGTMDFSDRYRSEIGGLLEESFPDFLRKSPSTDDVLRTVSLISSLPDQQLPLLTAALDQATDAASFLRYASHGFGGNAATSQAFKVMVAEKTEKFLSLKPTKKEISQLQSLLDGILDSQKSALVREYLSTARSGGISCPTWFRKLFF